MMLTLEDGSHLEPKDSSVIECKTHDIKTTYGALNAIQRLALEEGIDTTEDLECMLAPFKEYE